MPLFSGEDGIIALYRRSKKPKDLWWNEWVARPVAAVLLYGLRHTRLTPNQITFCSLFTSLATCAVLVLYRTHAGLLLAAFLLQLAFVLDCVDGQLARIQGMTSVVGAHLDFLMDEIKAFSLVAAVAGRLAWQSFDSAQRSAVPFIDDHAASLFTGFLAPLGPFSGLPGAGVWLAVGLLGVVIVASGISLTTFMRRPEYLQATGRPVPPPGEKPVAPPPSRSLVGRLVSACEAAGKAVLHYPQWFWLPAVFDRIDLFLLPYLAAHALYLSRAGLIVLWKLGRR